MAGTVVFEKLPKSLDEMKALPQAAMTTIEDTAALTIAALALYPENKEESLAMLDWLRGPRPMSPMEKQFINDRFMDGKEYLARSYFKGSSPDNSYTPDQPFTLEFIDDTAPMADEGYKRLYIKSGGADSPRPITLRIKPSEGKWYLWEQMLLAGIRIPVAEDPWA